MSALSTIARAAIASLMTIALADHADAAASCQQAARHLVTLIKNNWPSSDENTPGAPGDMIGWIDKQRLCALHGRTQGVAMPEHEARHPIRQGGLANTLGAADQPGVRYAPAAISAQQRRLGLAMP